MTDPHHVQLERIRRAIAALPEQAREVFSLHVVESLDFAVIAARLGLSILEVEQSLAEAICLIDRELRSQERGGAP